VTSAVASAVLAYIPSPDRGVWYLGPVPIRAYALCIIAGIVVAVVWGERRFVARGGAAGTVTDVAVFAVPFGLIGGRLYHVATDWPTYFGPGGDPVKALEIWEGGLGIWGAIALGAVGAWIGCRRRGVPLPLFADAVAPGIIVAQAIGRLGNYFNQELYGAPTELPWGLEIYRRVDPGTGLADPLGGVAVDHNPVEIVQPTFLYELILNLLVAALVVWADRRFRLGHGRAFAVYVAGYTLGRFFIEQMRTDQATRVFGDIRINVVVSVVVFIGAVIYIAVAPKGREELPPAATEDDDAPLEAAPGPDLRKPGADRPSGRSVAVAEPGTKVIGADAATTVLEVEQPTTYIEREPAAEPAAKPARKPAEQPAEEPEHELEPSVFTAVEPDTEVMRVPEPAAKASAPAAAKATGEPAAEEPAAPVAEKAEPAVAEEPVEPVEAEDPTVVERRAAAEEPTVVERRVEAEEPTVVERPAAAAKPAVDEEPAVDEKPAVVEAPTAVEEPAEPSGEHEPVEPAPAEEPTAAAAAEQPSGPAPSEKPAEPADEKAAEEPAAAEAVAPGTAEQPAGHEADQPAATTPSPTTPTPTGSASQDDEPTDQDRAELSAGVAPEQRVGVERKER
jgi:prolipoprotein diacylglyceryl transferase